MSVKVTVTVPAYLEKQFEELSTTLGLSRQDTFLHCLTESVTAKRVNPSGPTAPMTKGESSKNIEDEEDLYMLSSPERLKVYTFDNPGSCLRGEEIGEYHEIERGDKYAWQKFSRHSKQGVAGWEEGKNGKLCAECQPIALELWFEGIRSFRVA